MYELKFRAWNKGAGNYVFWKQHDMMCLDFDLEQFTGLQDKNGQDLYDGDIVLRPTGTGREVDRKVINGIEYRGFRPTDPEVYRIYNLGNAFYIGNKYDMKYCGVLDNARNNMAKDLEVIGNIHQNQELLD